MSENKNINSSGVDKVEKITKTTTANDDHISTTKMTVEVYNDEQKKREEALAKKRIEKAETLKEKQAQQKKEDLQKRIDKFEEDRARREEKLQAKLHKQEHRTERKLQKERQKDNTKRAPGFGGWLASVISLSVAVLALGTIVTVGYFDLNKAQGSIMDGYQSAVYEFSEHVENLDGSLAKARVANGSYEQQKLLTKIILATELASQSLEKFPADFSAAQQLAAQINNMTKEAWKLLYKQLNGQTFTAADDAMIEKLYQQVERMRVGLPQLMESTRTLKLEEMLKEGGMFAQGLLGLTESSGPDGDGVPQLTFKDSFVANMPEISEKEATEKAMQYFADYNITSMHMTGKTEEGAPCYTFEMKDNENRDYYCSITIQGGLLAMFSSYEAVTPSKYSQEECIKIAQDFLTKCGYNNMEAIWTSEAGNEMNVRFAYMQDDVAIYADVIDVKVCNHRGLATGLTAKPFIKNHKKRTIGKATLAQSKVEKNASKKLKLHGTRLALLPQEEGEVLTYEIRGDYGDRSYVVFIDANSGNMVEIYNVATTDRGRILI